MRSWLFLLLISACCHDIWAQRTALDSTFGSNGILVVDSPVMMQNNRIAVRANGKIVIAGTYYYNLTSFNTVLHIVRFLPDGRRDSTFNRTGLYTKITEPHARIAALNIQPDEKILITGSKGYLERYLPSGIPDSSFNDSGRVVLKFLGPYDHIDGTALQPDGKIVVTGLIFSEYLLVARFNQDGSPDNSFGFHGFVNTGFDSSIISSGYGITVQPDGRILVVGDVLSAAPEFYRRFLVARYLPDGYLDPTFAGGKGYIRISFPDQKSSTAHTIELLPDGKMIIGGVDNKTPVGDFINMRRCLTKLTAAGTLDVTFGNDGRVVADSIEHSTHAFFEQPCVKLQTDGKILVSTTSGSLPGDEHFSLLRLDSGGGPDLTFGNNGRIVTDITLNQDTPWDIALQPDGKILLCGIADQDLTWPQSLHSAPAIVRYLPDVNLNVPPVYPLLLTAQVYPNPINDYFTIRYSLATDCDVSIQLADVQGRVVQQWRMEKLRTKGEHRELLRLNSAISSGTYLITIIAGSEKQGFIIVKK